ncbi:hypothetical protein JP09_007120 [Dehalogenimonas etheniformans]|uniref:Response regulatory domain-containing protein n=2 Tax=Dehalogenimonas etheniformans TaxID=1536648 RepID=A0A2P5P6X7_9CHLR|nr:hypothetical protein [Dehalogenimonas etheniformans]PPD58052.1 hypothetical protein JP09_007120 [Dehalogenimonas etheniformans]
MNILIISRDQATSSLISNVVQMRWPESGKVVIVHKLDKTQMIGQDAYDLAIVDGDLKRPAMGIISRLRKYPNLPLLFVADPHGDQMETAWVLNHGCTDYLFKPINVDDLISTLESMDGVARLRTSPSARFPVINLNGSKN